MSADAIAEDKHPTPAGVPTATAKPPVTTAGDKTVAIACQGGGAHVAFGAGVLQSLLRNWPAGYRLIGLTGASGGAINATLVWYACLKRDPELAAQLLEDFWIANSAQTLPDMLVNSSTVAAVRLSEFGVLPMMNPAPIFGTLAQESLRQLIESHLPFAEVAPLVRPDSPRLLVSAIDVLNGEFHIFEGTGVTSDALLASCAIPEIFPPVTITDSNGYTGYFWDGLYSENPPVSGLLTPGVSAEEKPDEIWVIQINPENCERVPTYTSTVADRKNELAGNLSINQAIATIYKFNGWLEKLPMKNYKSIMFRRLSIPDTLDLDFASKLDRSPSFINELLALGRRTGQDFLAQLPDGNPWLPFNAPAAPVMHAINKQSAPPAARSKPGAARTQPAGGMERSH